MKRVLFAALLAAALGMFAWTLRRFTRLILAGRAEPRFDRAEDRVDSVLRYFFAQKKVVEKTSIPAKRLPRFVSALGSKYHFLIFWGFIVITIGSAETMLQGLFPSFSWAGLIGPTAGGILASMIDAFSIAVLALVVFAFFRRIVLQPRLIPMSRDAAAILGAIGLLMVTYFGMKRLDQPFAEICWWAHVVLLLAFLNYLLYSKHSHILAALPNIYFRKLGQRGIMPKLNMEADDIAATGVVQEWKDFSWKSLLDGYACTECARCTNFCPAYNTGKPLSPMQVIHDVRDDMRTRMPDRGPLDTLLDRFQHGAGAAADEVKPLVGVRTTEDVLWACTTCGACQEVCPVFIDHPEKIIQMRQNLVLVQEKVPPDLARTFTNLERNGNPWGIGADKRMDWAEGLGGPDAGRSPRRRIPALGRLRGRLRRPDQEADARARRGDARGGRRLRGAGPGRRLHRRSGAALGQRDAVPDGGAAEHRDDERQEGEEGRHRLPALPAYDQERVPAAGRQLRGPPPHAADSRAGGERQDRDGRGGQRRQGRRRPRKLTFHDPCYLGRWNGEYDAPRDVLDALPAGPDARIELPRNKEHGFCCGAGGGRMWMEEKIGTRVNHNRTDEIIASGADTVATACPFCTIMLRDGVQDRNAGDKVQVLNVSELVAKSMKRKRELDASSPSAE